MSYFLYTSGDFENANDLERRGKKGWVERDAKKGEEGGNNSPDVALPSSRSRRGDLKLALGRDFATLSSSPPRREARRSLKIGESDLEVYIKTLKARKFARILTAAARAFWQLRKICEKSDRIGSS